MDVTDEQRAVLAAFGIKIRTSDTFDALCVLLAQCFPDSTVNHNNRDIAVVPPDGILAWVITYTTMDWDEEGTWHIATVRLLDRATRTIIARASRTCDDYDAAKRFVRETMAKAPSKRAPRIDASEAEADLRAITSVGL
jgi:hypothetical protein